MRAPNTFASRARNNRIAKNARTVTDSVGSLLRITHARRVLEIRRPMSGKWESPSLRDGFRWRNGMAYVTGPVVPVLTQIAKVLYP